jgi:very-short-patch-repair endonuclease
LKKGNLVFKCQKCNAGDCGHRSAEGRLHNSVAQKGHTVSEETREKIRKTLTGKPSPNLGVPKTAEHRKKLSLANLGTRCPDGCLCERHQHAGKKCSEGCTCERHGHSWNHGLPGINKGVPHTKEHCENIGKAHRAIAADPEKKRALIERRAATCLARYGRSDGPKSDTIPEKLMEHYLEKHSHNVIIFNKSREHDELFNTFNIGKRWLKQCPVKGILVDFYQPDEKTVIFVDGCVFHACPECFPTPDKWLHKTIDAQIKRRSKDNAQTELLEQSGYTVIRLWEHEIKANDFSKMERTYALANTR